MVARKCVPLNIHSYVPEVVSRKDWGTCRSPKGIIFVLNALHCLVLFSKWWIRIQLSQRYIWASKVTMKTILSQRIAGLWKRDVEKKKGTDSIGITGSSLRPGKYWLKDYTRKYFPLILFGDDLPFLLFPAILQYFLSRKLRHFVGPTFLKHQGNPEHWHWARNT